MPLIGGKLKVVASADLGGLGRPDGAAVEYDCGFPRLWPALLPWIIILALLALKANRRPAAWLIWLPVLGLVAIARSVPATAGTDFLLDAVPALAFGLAAVWLLADYLFRSNRLLAFIWMLIVLLVFSGSAFCFQHAFDLVNLLPSGIVLALAVPVSALALSLAAWFCRNRPGSLALLLSVFLLLLGLWLAAAAPFFAIAWSSSGGRIGAYEFLLPVFIAATANFVILLPFLVLSAVNPFFRERCRALLHLTAAAPIPSPISKP